MAVPGNHRARFAHATTGVREQGEHELENLKVFVRWLGWWGAMREKSERVKRDRLGRGAERVKMAEGEVRAGAFGYRNDVARAFVDGMCTACCHIYLNEALSTCHVMRVEYVASSYMYCIVHTPAARLDSI